MISNIISYSWLNWIFNQINDIGNLVLQLPDYLPDAFVFNISLELGVIHLVSQFAALSQEVFHRVGGVNLHVDDPRCPP